VTAKEAIDLLETFRAGKVSREKVLRAFQTAPLVDLGFAQVDTHRALRKGFPEVVFGAGKTPLQVVQIAAKIFEREQRILVTRINGEHARALRRRFKSAVHHQASRCVTIEKSPLPRRPGTIAVLCAGTSDLTVDFTGSAAQITDRPVNMPFEGTVAVSVYLVVRSILLDTETHEYIPQNSGLVRPIHITAPVGSICNPTFPAPTTVIFRLILRTLPFSLHGNVRNLKELRGEPTS